MQTHYAERYRTLWERHWWWRSRQAWLLGWIDRLHRRAPRRRILDVGCGDGLFFEALGRFGAVEGLEPDAGVVTDPRWRPAIRLAPLGPEFQAHEPYDLILLLDVLEHIADDVAALAAARRALRPGGHLLVTVPALPWLWSRHDEANHHHRRYLPRSLNRVLRQAGFTVETVRFFFAWTVAPLLLRRLLTPSGRGGAGGDYDVPIPSPLINSALTALSRCEHALGRVVPWPLGSSLLAIARNDLVTEHAERATEDRIPRSHALRGHAVCDALRLPAGAETQSVAEGIRLFPRPAPLTRQGDAERQESPFPRRAWERGF